MFELIRVRFPFKEVLWVGEYGGADLRIQEDDDVGWKLALMRRMTRMQGL